MLNAKGRAAVGAAGRGWQLVAWIYLAVALVGAWQVGRGWSWWYAPAVLLTALVVIAPTMMLATLMSSLEREAGD